MVVKIEGRAEVWYPPEISEFLCENTGECYTGECISEEEAKGRETAFLLAVTCTSSHLMTHYSYTIIAT